MKKLVLSLLFLGILKLASAQPYTVHVYYDTWASVSGTATPNQTFWVSAPASVMSNGIYKFQTDANGHFYDSIQVPSLPVTISFITYDCQGNAIYSSHTVTSNQNYVGDTAIVPCGLNAACQSYLMQLNNSTGSGLTLTLADSLVPNFPLSSALQYKFEWSFGDGTGTTNYGQWTASHTYAQAGTYTVCVIGSIIDSSFGNILLCQDTICMQFTVGNPASQNCHASYWVDTTTSAAGNVFIWNNSTPAYTNTAYSISYNWDFGDGTTSTQPYPVHNYTSPGMYQVCLTITSVDSNSNICTDTFCDSLGMDAQGNLLYKTGSTGFTLAVLDPATVGLQVHQMTDVKIFPNPAKDEINVDLGNKAQGTISWSIYNLNGAIIQHGTKNSGSFKLDISKMAKGVYILSVTSGQVHSEEKLIIN